jgi:hypothetical protein
MIDKVVMNAFFRASLTFLIIVVPAILILWAIVHFAVKAKWL